MPSAHSKPELRAAVLAARASRPADAGRSALHIDPLLTGVRRVASYASLPSEAATSSLHENLLARGIALLLPRLLADGDLELADGPLSPGLRGTLAPTGAAQAWSVADLIVVPALAVSHDGVRLGRGGGSYDRALARIRPDVLIVALLTDASEFLAALPAEAHDIRVDAVALPDRLVLLGAPDGILSSRRP